MKKVLAWFLCASAARAVPAAAVLITIGNQGRVVAYPDLILASELHTAKANPVIIIRRWEWFASPTVSAGSFDNFTIKLGHTTRTTLTADFNDNYAGLGSRTVYSRSSQYLNPSPNDWFGFDLTGFY